MKFRKKPLEIEAIQWDGSVGVADKIEAWSRSKARMRRLGANGLAVIEVNTREGVMRCRAGDWVIKGIAGEFYPCAPEIFDATYEEVEI